MWFNVSEKKEERSSSRIQVFCPRIKWGSFSFGSSAHLFWEIENFLVTSKKKKTRRRDEKKGIARQIRREQNRNILFKSSLLNITWHKSYERRSKDYVVDDVWGYHRISSSILFCHTADPFFIWFSISSLFFSLLHAWGYFLLTTFLTLSSFYSTPLLLLPSVHRLEKDEFLW